MRAVLLSLMVLILVAGMSNAVPYQAGSFDPVRPNQAGWVCYDYAIDYARDNPEWGVVTISNNRYFYGVSHMVNYNISNGDLILLDIHAKTIEVMPLEYVHEGMLGFNPAFYHVWDANCTPLRNYRLLMDNSGEWN